MLDMLPPAQQAADLESAIADTRRSLADLEAQKRISGLRALEACVTLTK